MEEGRAILETLRDSVHPLIVFYPKLQRNWFPLWRRFASARHDMYEWVNKLLTVRRAQARNEQGTDVLGMLMNARDEQGNPVSDEHIRVELNSVLGAGHETTAVALAWALYELGRHPQEVLKLRTELESAGGHPDPNAVQALPYLDAIFKETIRLHPILAECARVPMEPLQIRGRTVAAGQALVISIVGIHHNPRLYPEPDRFYPNRFLERKYNNYEFLPFGGGHRRCLGAGLAEYSMKIALAEIASHWDFEAASPDYDIRNDIAMGPKYGVPLRIKARRSSNGSRS
jgi:cytochrome P450